MLSKGHKTIASENIKIHDPIHLKYLTLYFYNEIDHKAHAFFPSNYSVGKSEYRKKTSRKDFVFLRRR